MKTSFCFRFGALLCAFFFTSTMSIFAQGSLTPPGPPAPTMKTLDQVQPRTLIPGGTSAYTISNEGSYYLGGNLTISSGNAITVAANNVTIDLQGFELIGTGGSAGVFINPGISNVTVRNGTIRNFTSRAIDGQGNPNMRVEKVRALNITNYGIFVDVNGVVIDCLVQASAGPGIAGADNCVIYHCQSIGNTGTNSHGISVGNAAQITGCVARNNAGSGIVTGTDSTLSDCVATNNTTGGITVGDKCAILNSTANANGVNGGTTAGSNGISAVDACTITNCTGSGNTGSGLSVSAGGLLAGANVHHSTFNNNTLNGIDLSAGGAGSTVAGCTATSNGGDGIITAGTSIVIDNNCYSDNAGIVAQGTGAGGRIEGNNVQGSITGIQVTGSRYLIIRNSAQGNTNNYSIAVNNSYGPLVNVSAVGDISGTANANHPWANFSY